MSYRLSLDGALWFSRPWGFNRASQKPEHAETAQDTLALSDTLPQRRVMLDARTPVQRNLARLGVEGSNPFAAPVAHPTNLAAAFLSLEKARFRAVLRVGLGVPNPERYGNSLSQRRTLSEAWESTDLLYKLFSLFDQGLHNLQRL
jgi:hypothetical protein